jgi:hypothetical protein
MHYLSLLARTWKGRLFVLIVCLAGAIYYWWQVYGPSSMRPVDVYVQARQGHGVAFTVPAAYLKSPRRGGVTTATWILAVYPDMSPYYLLPREEREFLKQGQYIIGIRVQPTATDQTVQAIFADDVNVETFVSGAKVLGFDVYRNKRSGKVDEFLVPEVGGGSPGNLVRVIDCGPYLDEALTKRFFGICTAHVQPADGFYLYYDVARDYLPHWQEVERKTVELLKQFNMRCYRADLKEGEAPDETYPCELRPILQ